MFYRDIYSTCGKAFATSIFDFFLYFFPSFFLSFIGFKVNAQATVKCVEDMVWTYKMHILISYISSFFNITLLERGCNCNGLIDTFIHLLDE
jgi:hypothetical protein